jgi:hypothetical protein
MTLPRSIARAALVRSRAEPRPLVLRHAGYLDRDTGEWVSESVVALPGGGTRTEGTRTPVSGLNPRAVCEDCGRPPLPGWPAGYCVACGGRVGLTTARGHGPAGPGRAE